MCAQDGQRPVVGARCRGRHRAAAGEWSRPRNAGQPVGRPAAGMAALSPSGAAGVQPQGYPSCDDRTTYEIWQVSTTYLEWGAQTSLRWVARNRGSNFECPSRKVADPWPPGKTFPLRSVPCAVRPRAERPHRARPPVAARPWPPARAAAGDQRRYTAAAALPSAPFTRNSATAADLRRR